jgi:hypothetical protein
MRHISNVPDSAKVIVDGKELGIRDLKPGMKLQRTITTTKTPQTITTVESVTGKVWNVMAPSSVTLTLENGTNQTFKIPSGQKFTVDGQEVDAFGLRKGMQITATRCLRRASARPAASRARLRPPRRQRTFRSWLRRPNPLRLPRLRLPPCRRSCPRPEAIWP